MIRPTEWRMRTIRADFNGIGAKLGISPVMARVLVNRELDTDEKREEYLYGNLNSIPDPSRLLGMDGAVALLQSKIREGKQIRIISDYDVDGVTSNYILYDGLIRLGARGSYDIPDRIRDGYGMNVRLVEAAAADGVDTLLTCDNGIAAFDAIDRAKELGMTVIVTDHHQMQGRLPAADVIVNPWQPLCPYPYKTICGAEVAYKLMRALSEAEGNPLGNTDYLEFVALGTVCDVMPLSGENRILVREGMRVMPDTENAGLRALLSVNGLLDGRKITAYHLGFILGPSINSEGRLSSAKEAMRLLLTEDAAEAEQLAGEMKQLNDQRKSATEEGVRTAVEVIQRDGLYEKDHVLVVYVPGLHESLAGIVAGKVRERYFRPTIIFTDAEGNSAMLKGSARSIEAYNIFEALTGAEDLMDHFGGHPMAAGVTIPRENLEALRRTLNEAEHLTEEELVEKIYIDIPMPLSYVSLSLAEQLEQLEPFGTGNPKPVFAEKDLQIEEVRSYSNGKLLRLTLRDSRGNRVYAKTFSGELLSKDIKMWSECDECDRIRKYPKLDLIYHVSVNEYRGEKNVECWIDYYRQSAEA